MNPNLRVLISLYSFKVHISILVCATVAILLSACDFNDNDTRNKNFEKPTVEPTPLVHPQPTQSLYSPTFTLPVPVPTWGSPLTTTWSITQAWGANLQIAQVPIVIDDKHAFIFNTVTPDALFLVGSVLPRDADENGGTEPGKAVLLDVRTHQIIEMHHFPKNATQMGPASADAEWIVWSEAAQLPGFFSDWVIYSYNRNTHVLKQVVEAPKDAAGIVFTGGPLVWPKVDHGIAVWDQIPVAGPDNVHSLVMSSDLATGQVSTLTDLGQQPTISWPYVAWEGPNPTAAQTLDSTQETTIILLNLQSRETKALKSTLNCSAFALSGDAIAWISQHGDQVTLTNISESKSQIIAPSSEAYGGPLQYPSISERLVTWESYTAIEAWDRLEQKLIYVVNPYALQGASVANGNAYAWQSGGSMEQMQAGDLASIGSVLNVLDVSQLPVH